jgi:hypothetical protein
MSADCVYAAGARLGVQRVALPMLRLPGMDIWLYTAEPLVGLRLL